MFGDQAHHHIVTGLPTKEKQGLYAILYVSNE